MAIIHCTQKLLKELGNPHLVESTDVNSGELASWYANLLRINRRKCILFTNEKTLYSFLVPNVVKEHFKDFKTVFLTYLCFNLQAEGFGRDIIEKMREEHKELSLAKTANRSVLGSMNDFAFQYECYMDIPGGTLNANILAINSRVNDSPMTYLKYDSPKRVIRSLLERG